MTIIMAGAVRESAGKSLHPPLLLLLRLSEEALDTAHSLTEKENVANGIVVVVV